MAFRDEHEAALQRARSLERELERARDARDRAEKKLLEVVIERDALAAEVDQQNRRLEAAGLAAREAVQTRGSVGALGLVGIMVFAVIALGLCRSRYAPAPPEIRSVSMPPPPPERLARCEITSNPTGAEIVASRSGRLLGVTPASIAHVDWVVAGGVDVRRDGFVAVHVDAPADANACDQLVEMLRDR